MEYTFSDRIKNMTGNAIRDIFSVLNDPEMISFAGGMPARDALPVQIVKELSNQVLEKNGASILQYGSTEGYMPFRESAVEYVRRSGNISCSEREVFAVSGGQQGIDLACKALLNSGDHVLVERPTYLAVLQILQTYQAQTHSVEMDEDGLNLLDLEKKLQKYRPKFIYTIPNFQNPTGRTMSLTKRKKMLELAQRYNTLILEDDPYGMLCYGVERLPSIKSMDTEGCVVYLTSFSKVVSPGLRCGVAVAPGELGRKMVIGKQAVDVHTNSLSQAIIDAFLRGGYLDEQLKRSNEIHGHRKNHMLHCMEKYFPKEVHFTRPDGGLFIWAELPETCSAVKLFQPAIERKVAFIAGIHFFAEGDGANTMRLNFSNSDDERIERGIKTLGKLIAENL